MIYLTSRFKWRGKDKWHFALDPIKERIFRTLFLFQLQLTRKLFSAIISLSLFLNFPGNLPAGEHINVRTVQIHKHIKCSIRRILIDKSKWLNNIYYGTIFTIYLDFLTNTVMCWTGERVKSYPSACDFWTNFGEELLDFPENVRFTFHANIFTRTT